MMDLNNSGSGWGGFPVPAGALPLADSTGAAGFGSGFDAFGTGGVPDVVLPQVAPHMGLHPQHAQHAQHPQQHDANAWMWQQQQAQQQHAQLAVGAIGVPVLHAQPATQPSFGLGGAGFGNQLLSQVCEGEGCVRPAAALCVGALVLLPRLCAVWEQVAAEGGQYRRVGTRLLPGGGQLHRQLLPPARTSTQQPLSTYLQHGSQPVVLPRAGSISGLFLLPYRYPWGSTASPTWTAPW